VLANYLYRIPKRHYCDFRVYYKAGQDMLQGKNIYVRENEDVTPFKYSPFFAFVFSPLSLLQIQLAASVFLAINFFLTILLFYLSFRLAPETLVAGFSPPQRAFIYFLAFLFVSRYMFNVWENGQVAIIMAVLVLLSLEFFIKDKLMAAGAFLAAAILIKYTPAIFLPFFLFMRKPKVVLWTLGFVAVFLMLPALLVGFKTNMLYLTSWIPAIVGSSLDNRSYMDFKNQSIVSMVLRLLTDTPYHVQIISLSFKQAMTWAYAIVFLFYITAFMPSRTRPRALAVDLLLIILGMVIFNPNSWTLNYIALVPVFMLLMQYLMFNKGRDIFVLACLIFDFIFIMGMSKEFVGHNMEKFGDVHSFAVIGAIVLFAALLKIKFFTKAPELSYA
jgi:hypothetical protein